MTTEKSMKRLRLKLAFQYALMTLLVFVVFELVFFHFYFQGLRASFDSSVISRASRLEVGVALHGRDFLSTFVEREEKSVLYQPGGELVMLLDGNGNPVLSVGKFKVTSLPMILASPFTVVATSLEGKKEEPVELRTYIEPIGDIASPTGYIVVGKSMESLKESIELVRFLGFVSLPSLLVVFWLVGYFLSGLTTRPLALYLSKLNRFTADVAHEMKTPLSRIRTLADVGLMKTAATSSDFRAVLERINESATQMIKLIDDLLEFARSSWHSLERTYTEVSDLSDVVRDVVESYRAEAEKKEIKIDMKLEPNLKVHVPDDKLRLIVGNLVDNAIKFNREGGRIFIEGFHSSGRCLLSVRDTGIGIPPEHLPHVFERFYKVDQARDRRVQGTGLGLALVKESVEEFGGTISVHSKLKEGSTFVVEIPTKRRGLR